MKVLARSRPVTAPSAPTDSPFDIRPVIFAALMIVLFKTGSTKSAGGRYRGGWPMRRETKNDS